MTGKRLILVGVAAVSLLGCKEDWDRKTSERALGLRPVQLSGAIFTTDVDGTRVNLNQFECKQDVYLDGGPPDNAPSTSAALPEGDYYFQVTSPSGRSLLSSDAINCRSFHIDDEGLIDDVDPENDGCFHETGIDADHGALTVQLFPFDTTPNPGGVYKVWVTRVEDYDPTASRTHGFVPARSKTDNFKAGECEEEKGKIKACKDKVKREYPLEVAPLANWPIRLLGAMGRLIDEGHTGADGCITFHDLPPGSYVVEEPEELMVGPFTWGPFDGDPTSKPVDLDPGEHELVEFTNICVCNHDKTPECPSVLYKHLDTLCPPEADPPPPAVY